MPRYTEYTSLSEDKTLDKLFEVCETFDLEDLDNILQKVADAAYEQGVADTEVSE